MTLWSTVVYCGDSRGPILLLHAKNTKRNHERALRCRRDFNLYSYEDALGTHPRLVRVRPPPPLPSLPPLSPACKPDEGARDSTPCRALRWWHSVLLRAGAEAPTGGGTATRTLPGYLWQQRLLKLSRQEPRCREQVSRRWRHGTASRKDYGAQFQPRNLNSAATILLSVPPV